MGFGELSMVAANNCMKVIFEKLFEDGLDLPEGFSCLSGIMTDFSYLHRLDNALLFHDVSLKTSSASIV